jgi:hypothetical protein
MSHEATTWAWKQNIPYRAKFVLLALADWYNELESCAWPTQRRLAKKLGMPYGTVRDSLRWLSEVDLVVVEHHYKHNKQVANRYRLPVNMIVFQGVEAQQGGVESQQGGVEAQQPIIDTVKDTVKDTVSLASSPTQGDDVKISDVIETNTKTKKSIFEKFKPTPKGCADFWRDARATASDENGFAAELLVKDFKLLDNARKRVGDDFPSIVWKCMGDWVGFCKHAEAAHGAFSMGHSPTVKKFVLYVEAAADYYQQNKPVKSIAQPLTNKPASSKPIPKAKPKQKVTITLAEALAMNKDDV